MVDYRVDKRGDVFLVGERAGEYLHYHSWPIPEGTPASPEQIAAYEAEKSAIAARRLQQEWEEARLLTLVGLVPENFCRLRDVFISEGELVVSTRENGMGMRSVEAMRNPNYIDSHTDEGDSTYEWYRFKLKES